MENRIYDELYIDSGKICAEKSNSSDVDSRKIKSESNILIEWLYFDDSKSSSNQSKKYTSLSFDFKTLTEKYESDLLVAATSSELRKIIKEYDYSTENVLVVGLGNRNIQADSLGISVTDKLSIGNSRIKTFAPSIEALTGYSSFDAISAIVQTVEPSLIFIVDTLSAKSVSRLGAFLQLSNGGISAGSGVNNCQPILAERSLNVPVIAIGVPLVIYAKTIAQNFMKNSGAIVPNSNEIITEMLDGNENGYIVAPTSISLCIDVLSDVISNSIGQAICFLSN